MSLRFLKKLADINLKQKFLIQALVFKLQNRIQSDPEANFYTQSAVMSYSNVDGGKPRIYQAMSASRQMPGGVGLPLNIYFLLLMHFCFVTEAGFLPDKLNIERNNYLNVKVFRRVS